MKIDPGIYLLAVSAPVIVFAILASWDTYKHNKRLREAHKRPLEAPPIVVERVSLDSFRRSS